MNGSVLTLNLAQAEELIDEIKSQLPGDGTIAVVQDVVAKEFRVTIKQLTGPGRSNAICSPRFACYWLCRDLAFTLDVIGNAFNRDHGAVGNGIKRFESWMATEKRTRELATRLRSAVAQSLKKEFSPVGCCHRIKRTD